MTIAVCGQTGPTTAGTPVQNSTMGVGTFCIYPHPANTGSYMYLGYTSQTATSNGGIVLEKDVDKISITVVDASNIWVDSDTDADTICWVQTEAQNNLAKAPVGW